MADFVDRLGAALLDASLAATAISGFVVLAMVQCRQPARRRGWARFGLLSTLALLPLAALNPFPRIDLRGHLRSILSTESDIPGPPGPRRSVPGEVVDLAVINPQLGSKGGGMPAVDYHPPPSRLKWLARGAVLAYFAGLSSGLGLLAIGLWGSSVLIRRSDPPSEWAASIYSDLTARAGSPRPRLVVSDRAGRPVLLGFVRASILIPPELDQPSAVGRLRLGLLHELAHAESSDHRFSLVANFAQSIWFFLPPVWWIRDQMRLDQEFLADRRAVDQYGTSGHYASSLVELASAQALDPGETPSVSPSTTDPSVASALFQRVLMLLKCPFVIEGGTPVWWRWWAASTLVLATLTASCLTLRGFAGWSIPSESPATNAARSFRVPQLVIGPNGNDDQSFDLRFRLPEQFTLTLEILAEPTDLPTLEILGHRLGPPCDQEPAVAVYRLWHKVRFKRMSGIEEVEVDGTPVAGPSRSHRLATWLSIRPLQGQTTRVRDLDLSW